MRDPSYRCLKCGNDVKMTTNGEIVVIYCSRCRTTYEISTGDPEVAFNVAVEKGYVEHK